MIKKNYLILIIVILVIIMLFSWAIRSGFILTLLRLDCVVPDYERCVGIHYSGKLNYNYLLKKYGEPLEVIAIEENHEITGADVKWDKLTYSFSVSNASEPDNPEDWELYCIETTDPKHKFGKAQIHVGSSREDVISAYSKATAAKGYELGEYYFDGGWENTVIFTYDEEDNVKSIQFTAR